MPTLRNDSYYYGEQQKTRRPSIMGVRGVVSSGHYLASQAGIRILQNGGNAIDAGVAAGLCLNVLLPYLTNLGGVAPIILYSAQEKKVTTISGLGRWPRSSSIDEMKKRGSGQIPLGILRSVTPAALDAWVMAVARYGRLSFAEVAAPATELASEGFAVDLSLATALADLHHRLINWPSSLATFFPSGEPPKVGTILKQPDLAQTFKELMGAERSERGGRGDKLNAVRDLFYKGSIAKKIARFSKSEGGFLTAADLADFQVREEPPVSVNYRGYEIFACGPWCQGPAVPQALKLLEGFDLSKLHPSHPLYLHYLVEAIKLTYADRDKYYGDPDFIDVPITQLLSEDYARTRRSMLSPERAWPKMPPHGNPLHISEPTAHSSTVEEGWVESGEQQGDTSYVCSVDSEGNAFSATPSDFIGDSPVVPELGFVISGRGSQSWLDEGHASSLAPWKRPRLTPNPGLVMRDGELFMVFGTPGGDQQPQGMLQVFLNMVEFGMSPQEAVEHPRVGSESFPGSFWPHPYFPGKLNLEANFTEAVHSTLAQLGHEISSWETLDTRAGHVCVVMKDQGTGVLHGGADPRFTSYAIAW
ncbi:gamma-glutamyltransferase family protein [Dehalococcoidia bacterium]|nr:gamma-glutamyltransferase family protein [Dehalococcoidia bacterium]